VWALIGTMGGVGLTLFDLGRTEEQLGGLVVARPDQPAAALLAEELGPEAVRAGGGHDGAFFYAIARDPWHLDANSDALDAPRYRTQRILFPLLGWLGHPTGGGQGLVLSLFAVGVLALFVGAMGMGALSVTLRGPPWLAVLFPLMIGSFLSLRLTVADPLSMALVLVAVVLLLRGHLGWALVAATAAVLAKETAVLLLVGIAIHRRDRAGAVFAAVPAAVGAGWAIMLRLVIPFPGSSTPAFGPPLSGLFESVQFWARYDEPLGWMSITVALVLTVAALVKHGIRHPLAWAIILQLALLCVVTASVLGPERNASRAVLPLTVLAIVMLATPTDSARSQRALTDQVA